MTVLKQVFFIFWTTNKKYYYFQPTLSKTNTAFLLFFPRADNNKVSSLKTPQDFNNGEISTFLFTGYS